MLSLQSLNLIEESFVSATVEDIGVIAWISAGVMCALGELCLPHIVTLAKYNCFNRLLRQKITNFFVFSVAWQNTIVSTDYRSYLSFSYFQLPGTIPLFRLITATDHILVFSILICLAQYDCFN